MPSTLPSLLDGQKLLLVGCGKMGSALLQGWLNAGLEAAQFYVQEPNPDAALADLGVHLNVHTGPLQEATPSVIILAIKPQLAVDVLPSIALLAAPEPRLDRSIASVFVYRE